MDLTILPKNIEEEVRGKEENLSVATMTPCPNILLTNPCISHRIYNIPSLLHLLHPAPPHGSKVAPVLPWSLMETLVETDLSSNLPRGVTDLSLSLFFLYVSISILYYRFFFSSLPFISWLPFLSNLYIAWGQNLDLTHFCASMSTWHSILPRKDVG